MAVPSSDDRPFRHYSIRHRLVAWISRRLFDSFTYTVRRGLLKGMKRKGGLAWLPEFLSGSARPPEEAFWRDHDLTGLVIYDVGAFHGLLTMFFARRGRQVISYEPNTENHARLVENVRLNGLSNVIVRKVGLGSKAEVATMASSPLTPGGATVEHRAVSSLLSSKRPVQTEEISIKALDEDIREIDLPAPEFIKIDVEGGELAALRGARNTLLAWKPRLFLEMHGETMNEKRRNAAEIVACLQELGYTDIRHVETGAAITAANSALAARGHLYCRWPDGWPDRGHDLP